MVQEFCLIADIDSSAFLGDLFTVPSFRVSFAGFLATMMCCACCWVRQSVVIMSPVVCNGMGEVGAVRDLSERPRRLV